MASMDQGVANLQRFIGHLVNATGALGQVDEHLQAKGKTFTELEHSAGEEGDGLSAHIQEASQALDTGKGEVETALADVGRAGTEGEQTLHTAEDLVHTTATDLEEKVQTALTHVGEAHTALTDQGFTALGHTLDQAEQDLQKELAETEQQLDTLEKAVQGFQAESDTAWHEAEGALEKATGELNEEESTVTKEATDGVHAFETAATEVESHCTTLQTELEQLYQVVTSGVESQGHQWEQAVQELGKETATFVHDGQQNKIDEPATMLDNEALHALSQEYETVGTLLEVAGTTATELEPLGEDLVKSQAVMVDVDDLMNALAG